MQPLFGNLVYSIPPRRKDFLRGTLTFFELLSLRFGIGHSSALFYCKVIGIHPLLKKNKLPVSDWMQALENEVRALQEHAPVFDSDLNTYIRKRLRERIRLKALRGLRYRAGYPIHGQRTRSNYETARHIRVVQNIRMRS